MKTKKKLKNPEIQGMCTTQEPPWRTAKSKLQAYERGEEAGELKVYRLKEQDEKLLKEQITRYQNDTLLRLLQALSSISEAASKAMMSYKGQL